MNEEKSKPTIQQRFTYTAEFWDGPAPESGYTQINFALRTFDPKEALEIIIHSDVAITSKGPLKSFNGPCWGTLMVEV